VGPDRGVPTDEYADYAPQVLALVRAVFESDLESDRDGAPESFDALVAEWSRLRIESVGLRRDPDGDRDAALKLCDWYGWSED